MSTRTLTAGTGISVTDNGTLVTVAGTRAANTTTLANDAGWGIPGQVIYGQTNAAGGAGLTWAPFFVPSWVTVTDAAAMVTVAPGSDSSLRVGIYDASGPNGGPGQVVLDSGSVAVATGFTGIKSWTGLSAALSPGWHWSVVGQADYFGMRKWRIYSVHQLADLSGSDLTLLYKGPSSAAFSADPGSYSTSTGTVGHEHFVLFKWTVN